MTKLLSRIEAGAEITVTEAPAAGRMERTPAPTGRLRCRCSYTHLARTCASSPQGTSPIYSRAGADRKAVWRCGRMIATGATPCRWRSRWSPAYDHQRVLRATSPEVEVRFLAAFVLGAAGRAALSSSPSPHQIAHRIAGGARRRRRNPTARLEIARSWPFSRSSPMVTTSSIAASGRNRQSGWASCRRRLPVVHADAGVPPLRPVPDRHRHLRSPSPPPTWPTTVTRGRTPFSSSSSSPFFLVALPALSVLVLGERAKKETCPGSATGWTPDYVDRQRGRAGLLRPHRPDRS